MTLHELIEKLQNIEKECNYEAHPMTKDFDVYLWVRDASGYIDDSIGSLEVDYIEPNQLFGCGCWAGAEICLKKAQKKTKPD